MIVLIDEWIQPIAKFVDKVVFWKLTIGDVQLPYVVLFLFSAAVGFTVYLRFPVARYLVRAIRIVFEKEPTGDRVGEVTHFQALATAVAGTVGIGNIANVAVAISIGGPGVVFWMVIAGFLGAASKMMECTLSVAYRTEHDDGSVSGGPMYYLRDGFRSFGFPRVGKVFGSFYAVCLLIAVLGAGNMFQSNQAYRQMVQITGGVDASWFADKGWLFGVMMAGCLGLVIIGGIKSIARVTEKLVPFMALLYLVLALIVILMNAHAIPFAIETIIVGAFRPEGIAGGAIGVAVMGVQRSVFSNEAGIGTASIVHSSVSTNYPASEGLVSLLEPIIDTVIICTVTAMVVITASYDHPALLTGELSGIELTSEAFEKSLSFAPLFVSLAAVLFAFSTLIGWSYYGLKAWTFLFGPSAKGAALYKLIFCGAAVLGCTITLKSIILFSDAMVFLIAAPNLAGIIFLAPIVRRELDKYLGRTDTPSTDGDATAQ